MAREAGFREYLIQGSLSAELERFAALVSAAEREACANVVDDFGDEWMCDAHMLSKIIRARGKA
jgi:hypothetical protein